MLTIPDFKFGHEIKSARLTAASAAVPTDLRGDLVHFLAGAANQRQWQGTGFNIIWRPDHDHANHNNPNDFFLEINETVETLSFQDITGSVPGRGIANRGALQRDIQLGGISYIQQISDANLHNNAGLHFEPGVWINVEATNDPLVPPSIARMGSIPHGTTINLQGKSFGTVQNPAGIDMSTIIAKTSITPSQIQKDPHDESKLVHFAAQENIDPQNIDDPSRTKISILQHVDQPHLQNPNLYLLDALRGLKITKLTTLKVGSDPRDRDQIPTTGGGITNIAFLEGNPNPNADATPASAIFWIEEGIDSEGNALQQLQYTQRVLLKFNGLNWPHITVATLRPV